MVFPIRRAALEQKGLQRVHAANGAWLCTRDADLAGPMRRRLRRVVAKTKALPHEHYVESHVRLALRGRIQLVHEVACVVERDKTVIDPRWQLPRQLLWLPPRRDPVPHIAAIQPHMRSRVLPHARAQGQRVRKHHARGNALGLHVRLRVVSAAIGGGEQSDGTPHISVAREDVEKVAHGVGHHRRVRAEQVGAIGGLAPVGQLSLAPGADRAQRVGRRAHGTEQETARTGGFPPPELFVQRQFPRLPRRLRRLVARESAPVGILGATAETRHR
mmetsp:Transcript_102647/g.313939  ORF Transcript_102647/g.313939 Transcript_102647/m.313939 type:complete len:274 (-) Transcript_102647:32-853(-)